MTSVRADDIDKPGGLQRLLDAATETPGHPTIMCIGHTPPAEMERQDNEAKCPVCGSAVLLGWVPE
jgi:hypothetical protein